MTQIISGEQLQNARDRHYRRLPARRLTDERDAVQFLNSVGMSLLFSAKAIELPTLWGAICGEDRTVPRQHDDYELGLAWQWKDTIPGRREVLYGKFLKGRPVFISLDLAPSFYALSDNYGSPEDYLDAYHDGLMSEDAKRVYEALLEKGPLPTSELRREAGISSKGAAKYFDRAITELQMSFRIVKTGISDANRWGYCYVYDLFLRHFPELVAEARHIRQDDAAVTILTHYLATVFAAKPASIGRLLGWDNWRLQRAIEQVLETGQIAGGLQIEGQSGDFLVHASLRHSGD
jgi:hypothetical protein